MRHGLLGGGAYLWCSMRSRCYRIFLYMYEISLSTTNTHYLQVSLVSCICFLFIVVNCKSVYDLKTATHGRNMSSSSNQQIRSYDSCVLTDPPTVMSLNASATDKERIFLPKEDKCETVLQNCSWNY